MYLSSLKVTLLYWDLVELFIFQRVIVKSNKIFLMFEYFLLNQYVFVQFESDSPLLGFS